MVDRRKQYNIYPENFLGVLGLRGEQVGINSPKLRDDLYQLAVEYLEARELIVDGPPKAALTPGELPVRIPKTSIVVRLGRPETDELKAIIAVGSALLVSGSYDSKTISLGVVLMVLNRLRNARREYGEVCILDVIPGALSAMVDNFVKALYGLPCRYPRAGCRFMTEDKICAMDRQQAEQTVQGMVNRRTLNRKNEADPIEYGLPV